MNYHALLARIRESVDTQAYFAPVASAPPEQAVALEPFQRLIASPDFDPQEVRGLVHRLHDEGLIDRVRLLSCLHIVEAHPRVANWAEAARLAGEQEMAALERGGPYLQPTLASVDRHRGVLAFLRGHHEIALDYFSRALERERSAENLQNVLCTMLRLGEESDARELLGLIRRSYPSPIVSALDDVVRRDPDLALLRED